MYCKVSGVSVIVVYLEIIKDAFPRYKGAMQGSGVERNLTALFVVVTTPLELFPQVTQIG